jgi:UPF0755 protein
MKDTLFKLAGVLLIVVSAVGGWMGLDYKQFVNTPLRVGPDGVDFIVEPGASFKQLSGRLVNAGVIDDGFYFSVMARLRGDARQIQAGEYHLNAAMKPHDMLDMLVQGEVIQHSLTVVEGWTFRQMMAAIANNRVLNHELTTLSDEEIMARLGWPDTHPEGRFMPDTYQFTRGTTDIKFLQRAYRAMESALAEAWENRAENLPLKTPYEALILASIIEKETAVPDERRAIAGVFVRRLQKGMRLQTDPTVIYGLGERYDGNIRKRDLLKDTPYNTYTRKGLPPTPIALPGRASIEAALDPQDGDALYFVARGDGSHHFSATFEQHNKAVRKYQLKR